VSKTSPETSQISFCKILEQIVPSESTAEEVSIEWLHHRISSTDLKVKLALEVSIIDSGSERVNLKPFYDVESGG